MTVLRLLGKDDGEPWVAMLEGHALVCACCDPDEGWAEVTGPDLAPFRLSGKVRVVPVSDLHPADLGRVLVKSLQGRAVRVHEFPPPPRKGRCAIEHRGEWGGQPRAVLVWTPPPTPAAVAKRPARS